MSSPYLYISSNGSSRRVDVGEEPVTIGRQIANMIVIEDTEASRFHCVIEKVAAGYRVRDLGSRNGTKVNGQLVKVALLDAEDIITIGKTEIRLITQEAQKAAPAKPARDAIGSTKSAASHDGSHDETMATGSSLQLVPMNDYESLDPLPIDELESSPLDVDDQNDEVIHH